MSSSNSDIIDDVIIQQPRWWCHSPTVSPVNSTAINAINITAFASSFNSDANNDVIIQQWRQWRHHRSTVSTVWRHRPTVPPSTVTPSMPSTLPRLHHLPTVTPTMTWSFNSDASYEVINQQWHHVRRHHPTVPPQHWCPCVIFQQWRQSLARKSRWNYGPHKG